MLVTEDSLPDVYRLALSERAKGKAFVYVDLSPRGPVAKFVQLWEGIAGEIVGRHYYEDAREFNPDLPPNRSVRSITVRVRIPDVTEAMRRATERDKREMESPLAANRVMARPTANTAR